jgi:hypothetical protein
MKEPEPGRLWRQVCCRYEQPFTEPDNFTFAGDSDIILHRPNEVCPEEAPHDLKTCLFFLLLSSE